MAEVPREVRERLAAEYQQLLRIVAELQRRIDLINAALEEISQAKAAIEELEKLDDGEEILVPVGANVMIRVSYKKTGRLVLGVGGGVFLERDFEGVRKYLDRRENALNESLQRIVSEYRKVVARMSEIERQLGAS